ncbi:MAG: alpha/beta fold hydrolase [Pseudomonadales bacterium]
MSEIANTAEQIPLRGDDGQEIYAVRWLPDLSTGSAPRGSIVIAHGMGEHILRYEPLARALTEAGYAAYGKDHRGHGRTADPSSLGDMGEDGWNKSITDTRNMVELARSEQRQSPCVLLGHSMGAMLGQQFLYRHGYLLDAVVLSGSPGFGNPLAGLVSLLIAQFERLRLGGSGESALMQKLLFGKSNDAFDGPTATGFEWLSRDPEQVQHYVDDDFCGFVLRTASLVRLFNGAREAARETNVRTIPKTLPLYIFSGSDDPVHDDQSNLQRMLEKYRAVGLQPEYKIYPGGRHEMFNETNSDEVTTDLLDWLARTLD